VYTLYPLYTCVPLLVFVGFVCFCLANVDKLFRTSVCGYLVIILAVAALISVRCAQSFVKSWRLLVLGMFLRNAKLVARSLIYR